MTDKTTQKPGIPSQSDSLFRSIVDIFRMAFLAAIPLAFMLTTIRLILNAFGAGNSALGVGLIVALVVIAVGGVRLATRSGA